MEAYILQEAQDHFTGVTCYHGMYRDDGLVVFNSQWTYYEVTLWMDEFQTIVNTTAGGE